MDNSADDFSGDEYEQNMEECEDTQMEWEQDEDHFGIEEQIDIGTVEGLFVEGVVPNERNWSKEEGTDEEGVQEYLEREEEGEEGEEGEEKEEKEEKEGEKDVPHVEGEEGEIFHEKNTTEKTGTDTINDTGDNSFHQQKGEENISNFPHTNATDEKEDTLHNDIEKKDEQKEEEENEKEKEKRKKKTEEVGVVGVVVHPKSKNGEQEKVHKLFIKNTETNYLKNIWNPKNIDLTQLKYENYKNKNLLFPSLSPTNIPIPGREKEKVEMLHMDTEKHGYKYNNGLNPAEGYLFVYPHVSNNTIPPKIRKKRLPCC